MKENIRTIEEEWAESSFLDDGLSIGNTKGRLLLTSLGNPYISEVMERGDHSKININIHQDVKIKTKVLEFEEKPSELANANITKILFFKTNGTETKAKIRIYDTFRNKLIYFEDHEELDNLGRIILTRPMKTVGGRKYKAIIEFQDEVEFYGTYRGEIFVPFFQVQGVGFEFKKVVSFRIWTEREYEIGELIFFDNKIWMCIKNGMQHGEARYNLEKWISLDKLLLKLYSLGDNDKKESQ